MRKSILTFCVLLIGTLLSTANAQEIGGAEITLTKEIHDYGKIAVNSDGTCTFSFTNTGTTPLIISKAKGSCGCTVPQWSKEPIAPGATSEISVKYNTSKVGLINRTVTIFSNAENAPQATLRVKGEVLADAISNPEKPKTIPVQK